MLKRLRCFFTTGHDLMWVRNIYGDEINQVNGNRSWWMCRTCRTWYTMPTLYKAPKYDHQ